MTKAILHLGYPKTGTTYLQRKIFPQAARYFSVITPEFENCGINIKKTAQHVQSGAIPSGLRQKVMRRPLLLSSESFLFDALRVYSHGRSAPTSFPQALMGLKSLCGDIPANSIDIVLYLRRQDDLIHSLYSESKVFHYASIKHLDTLEKYANAVIAEQAGPEDLGYYYDFANTLADIRKAFPSSTLHLRSYEGLNSDGPREIEFWSRLCGVQLKYISGRENVRSASDAGKRADERSLRVVILKLKHRFFPRLKLPNRLSRKLRLILSSIRLGEAEMIVMDEGLRGRLRSHFATVNEKLLKNDGDAARSLDPSHFETEEIAMPFIWRPQ